MQWRDVDMCDVEDLETKMITTKGNRKCFHIIQTVTLYRFSDLPNNGQTLLHILSLPVNRLQINQYFKLHFVFGTRS